MKKKNRVTKAQEFQELIHKGEKAVSHSFVFYYKPKKEAQNRIGISVPTKIGHAVDRNLYKRQIRMMCEELIDFHTCPIDGILIVRFAYKDCSYETNKKNLEKVLRIATMK